MPARLTWISTTPVKGLRLRHLDEAELTEDGIPGDRAFVIVDEENTMISTRRLGPLVEVVAGYNAGARRLALTFPAGDEVAAPVEVGDPQPVRFFGMTLDMRPVDGPFSAALSEHCGMPLRLFAAPPERPCVDRGRDGAATLLSLASLERLREQAGEQEPVDSRRFRMTFGVDGLRAHEEDGWVGREVSVGDAVLRVGGHVGRCAATTRNPETGVVDFKALHHLESYRGELESTERLPFGVHARVVRPGRVRVGDPVRVADA